MRFADVVQNLLDKNNEELTRLTVTEFMIMAYISNHLYMINEFGSIEVCIYDLIGENLSEKLVWKLVSFFKEEGFDITVNIRGGDVCLDFEMKIP